MLKSYAFKEEDLKMMKIYENSSVIQEIEKASSTMETPEKITKNYGDLFFPDIFSLKARPYFVGSVILTMDGRMGFENDPSSRTLAQSNELDPTKGLTDLWMVNVLRTYADAILLGSATLHAEPNFTGHVYDWDLQQYRLERSEQYKPIPWNILITRTPEKLPWKHPVLNTAKIPVLMVIPANKAETLSLCTSKEFCFQQVKVENKSDIMKEELTPDPLEQHLVLILPEKGFPDWSLLMESMNRLRIRQVTVESPYWMYELMKNQALDEIFVTQTGVYAGGNNVPGVKQAFISDDAPLAELVSMHMTGSNVLMMRQLLRYGQREGITE